jgi:RHS repeat-associated protein
LTTVKDASTGATLANFQYDAFGRRTENAAGDGVLYDGVNAVQELSGTTPVVNRLTGGVDEFFSRTDSVGTTFPLTDALGSTIALTDSSGTIQTQYSYEPFGATTPTGATSSNWYQFTGRANDGTGLYYYRARYYSPRFQRFISEDPTGLAGGVNLYAYVGDNPINFYDPYGLDKTQHQPWYCSLFGFFCGGGNPGNSPSPPNPQPSQPPNSEKPKFNPNDYRPHASKEGCEALEDAEFFGEALDILDTAASVEEVFAGEEVSGSAGPAFPSMLSPSYIIENAINHYVANCK